MNYKLGILINKGIIITPEITDKGHCIQINRSGIIVRGTKTYTNSDDLNKAILKAIDYEYNKLNK